MTIKELLEKHALYEENPKEDLIQKAYDLADAAHLDQKRLNGDPMIQHPLAVADILADIRADSTTLAAALLHDVIEETGIAALEIEKEFGEEVSDLVSGLTVVKEASERARSGTDVDNLRHLILSTVRDPRVLAIRLAEKIHNLKTSEGLSPRRRRGAAERVFSIWAPLAGLMGVYRLKAELEDLAFANLYPKDYQILAEKVRQQGEALKSAISLVKNTLESGSSQEKIPVEVHVRTKHLYGVYRKMERYQGKAEGKFYDVLGSRVIASNVEECYRILDLARGYWEEEPDLFDDYIAHPKDNGYQSIHAVFKVEGKLVEIQIRTKEMHERAEYGLAAHPLYKLKETGTGEKIAAIRNLIKWEKGTQLNLFPDKVFAITPKGDVKVLPKGATPVDFAYAVHDRIGDECREAKVDGVLKPLHYELKTGEIVEIVTQRGKKPSTDWLKFIKTDKAREQVEKSIRNG